MRWYVRIVGAPLSLRYELDDRDRDLIGRLARLLPWPPEHKLKDPAKYHATALFCTDGGESPEHVQWASAQPAGAYAATLTGVHTFTRTGDMHMDPVVIELDSLPAVRRAEQIRDEADRRGLTVSRFGPYRAHITIGLADGMPGHLGVPDHRVVLRGPALWTP